MAEFHETKIGRQFYDRTMPALVKQLERLNELLEQLASKNEQVETGHEDAG